jgi:hypothetical protein
MDLIKPLFAETRKTLYMPNMQRFLILCRRIVDTFVLCGFAGIISNFAL